MNATQSEGLFCTFSTTEIQAIDKLLTQLNIKLPRLNQFNRQDFIRMAVAEKIEQLEQREAGVKP